MIDNSNKLLILDLDETLVHAAENKLSTPCQFMCGKYHVYKRPYLQEFLREITKHFMLGIWSSASDDYVFAIADMIKPTSVAFEMVWARSKCSLKRDLTFDSFYFEKNIKKLKRKGYNPEKIIMVDDSPEKLRNNYGNAVYIKEFSGDPADEELKYLLQYLLTLKAVENIRTIEKRGWRKNKL